MFTNHPILSTLLDSAKKTKKDYIWNLKCNYSPEATKYPYYNKLYNDSDYKASKGLGITDSIEDQDLVVTELNALKNALNDGTVVVTAVLNTQAKA